MKEKRIEKTMHYDPSADLNGVLTTFEKTVADKKSVDITFAENTEDEAEVEIVRDRRKSLNIFIIVLCAVIAAGIIVFSLFYFGVLSFRKDYGVVVRRTNGTVFLCSSKERDFEQTVSTSKLSQSGRLFAFADNSANLYYMTLRGGKNRDAVLVAPNITEDYYIFSDRFIIYKSGRNYYYFDTEKNENKILSDNLSDIIIPKNSSVFFYLNSKKSLYIFTLEKGPSLLCDKTDFYELYQDGIKVSRLVYGVNSGNLKKLYCCDADGNIATVCDSAVDYYCGEKNEVWDNIYYFKSGKTSVSVDITFSDEYADTDAAMSKPKESDYQKTMMFGLINYVDAERYKKAYIEYEEKLARDSMRAFAKNYISGKASEQSADVFAFSDGKSLKVASGIGTDSVIAFCPAGKGQVIFRKTNTVISANLEIADIAKDITGDASQEDFNRYVDGKMMSRQFSDGLYSSGEDGEKGITLDIPAEYDKLAYSPDGSKIMAVHRSNSDKALSVTDLKTGKREADINKFKEYLFVDGMCYILKSDGELFCCNSGESFAQVKKLTDNVTELKHQSDGTVLSISKASDSNISAGFIKGENYLPVFENAEDYYYRNSDEIFFIKDKKLYTIEKNKSVVIAENAANILK